MSRLGSEAAKINSLNQELVTLLGSAALLVYSIDELSKSVQYLAGNRFRAWINFFGENRFYGIILGIIFAMLLTSSGAVTVMLVGLANARLMSIPQVFSVTLGASIGSTFIVHLFAFKSSDYGLLLMAIGVVLSTLSTSDRIERVARAVLFLGMMFFSMSLLGQSGKTLEKNEFFNYVIKYFHDMPLVSLFISAIMTALIQSSAATIAFVMSLMTAQHSTVYEAFPWVLGANLGTTATAYIASFKSGRLGKQAALGHLVCKIMGVVLCFPLMRQIAELCQSTGGDVAQQIAVSHTLFNVVVAALFFPFISIGVRLVQRLVPEGTGEKQFEFRYLDPRTLESPELALAQAQREILRLSDTVEQMVEKSIHLFKGTNEKDIESLKAMDQVVDFLNRGIKLYLTKMSQADMTPEQVQKEFELLLRTNDLENIGDIIDKNILELVRKNMKKGYAFSAEGWSEIMTFHAKVLECLRISTAYFTSHDRALAAKLMVLHQQIEDLTLDLSENHVQRLHRGVKESLDTTSVHLDLIGNLQRISTLSINFTRIFNIKNSAEETPKI